MDRPTFERLPIAALLTRDGVVEAVNPAYVELLGVPAEELVGRAVQSIIAERIDAPDTSAVERAAASHSEGRERAGSLWVRALDAKGRPRSVRVEWRPAAHDPSLNVVYLFDEGGALEAKRAAEGFARAASELYGAQTEREVLERAADAIAAQGFTATFLLLRGDEPLLEYGPTRSPITFQGRSEIEAAPLPRAILTQINPRFHEGRAAFLQLGDSVRRAYDAPLAERIERAGPGRFTLQAPLFVGGEAYGALTITSDHLTPALAGAAEVFAVLVARAIENVRLRATMIATERLAAIGEAAAVMAHEVRNPIAAMLNAVALLRRGQGASEELLTMLTEEAHALEHIVSDLLSLGRPITPRLSAEDLRAPVARAVSVMRAREASPAFEVHAEHPADVLIDADLVQIAVMNLLRNAREAAPEGTVVSVWVEAGAGEATVRIEDRGPGIPSTLARRVFEPFFTTRPAGTGIGLAAVRRIVEACGGRVEVGASDDGGARVTLAFPRA